MQSYNEGLHLFMVWFFPIGMNVAQQKSEYSYKLHLQAQAVLGEACDRTRMCPHNRKSV